MFISIMIKLHVRMHLLQIRYIHSNKTKADHLTIQYYTSLSFKVINQTKGVTDSTDTDEGPPSNNNALVSSDELSYIKWIYERHFTIFIRNKYYSFLNYFFLYNAQHFLYLKLSSNLIDCCGNYNYLFKFRVI